MGSGKERATIKVQAERAVLAAVRLPESSYDHADPFGELSALAQQAGAVVVGTIEQRRQRPEAGTYIGSGKIDELRGLCEATEATTIIFDHDLSPKQIGKIEQLTERKVLDRSELILDIFASRATTHEAKLQVELAQLEYTYPRLRAMWTHLERIVGGSPGGVGTRGPGEQQLEIDRRLVQKRQLALKAELREIQGRKRREVRARNQDHFTVGLVGYTNAGKSTLFNALTSGGAYADDRLFATLVTRTREWAIGTNERVMLSDTVGFVRDLPHDLVASFKATLEEATHADLLLIVLDVSDPAAELHYRTVQRTLDELFAETESAEARESDAARAWEAPECLVLLNKVDRLADNREVLIWQQRVPGSMAVSALAGDDGGLRVGGLALLEAVRGRALGPMGVADVSMGLGDSHAQHLLETRTEVLDRSYENQTATLRVRIGTRQLDRLRSACPGLSVRWAEPPVVPPPEPWLDFARRGADT